MKRILKKLLIIFLIFLTINTFIVSNVSNADWVEDALDAVGEGIIGFFAWPVQFLLKIAGTAISSVTAAVAYIDGTIDGEDTSTITPLDILFNTTEKPKVKIVNINVFDISEPESITGKIRIGIATWYYVLRIIATAILLVILIYVGIRMAITTIASDKAMYSKMLIDWVTSLALIFLLQYIILFTFYVNDALVEAMSGVAEGANIDTAIEQLREEATAFGYKGIGAAAVYFILVTQTIGLLISYINRMLKVSFLVIISPLITLTYSIDKMGDGKAQALGTWLKEFVFTVLMQPFHCIIYMIMVSTALNLLTSNLGISGSAERLGYAIFAVICIRFIQEAEKIVRKIFHFEDDNSGTSVAAGMAMSAMMLSQSKNIGRTLKSGVTTAKNLKANGANAIRHLKTDAMVMGAVLTGKNKTDVTRTVEEKSTDEDGKEVTTTKEEVVGQRNMTYAELKEQALAKQVEKKADKIAGKVAGTTYMAYDYSDKKSRDDLKTDEEKARYDTLRNNGMGHSRAMATLRKEALEKKKKENFEKEHPHANTVIRKARGVVNSAKTFNQLDVIKDLKSAGKTYISAAVGAGVGLSMYGNGRDLMQSGMMGAAAFSSTQEFMKDTTKNLVDTAAQSVSALNASSPEEARNIAIDALQSDSTRFEDNSDEMNNILENLKNQLKALGMNENAVNKFSNKIHKEVRRNAMKGNPESIGSIMQKNLQQYNDTAEGKAQPINMSKNMTLLEDAMNQTSDFENKKVIYDNFQQASQATGISADAYLDEIVGSFKSIDGASFSNPGSDNSPRKDITNDTIDAVKAENDGKDVADATERAEAVVEETIEAAMSKLEKGILDTAEIEKIKTEMKTDLEGKIQTEVKTKIEEIQRSSDKEIAGIRDQLLKDLADYESKKRELEQKQAELEAGTKVMDSAERIDFEKSKIRTEYQIQTLTQQITYATNYTAPKRNNEGQGVYVKETLNIQ